MVGGAGACPGGAAAVGWLLLPGAAGSWNRWFITRPPPSYPLLVLLTAFVAAAESSLCRFQTPSAGL